MNDEQIKQNLKYIDLILKTGDSLEVNNKNVGLISIDKGNIGRSGNGMQHIIEQRFEKNNKTIEEITAILPLIIDSTTDGKISRNTEVYQDGKDIGTYDLEKNGIIAFISKTRDGNDEKFVITGFDDSSKKKEADGAIKAVIAENSYDPEFVIVKNQVVAVLTSAYSLHLKELNDNIKRWDDKKKYIEIKNLSNYLNTNDEALKKFVSDINKSVRLSEETINYLESKDIKGFTIKNSQNNNELLTKPMTVTVNDKERHCNSGILQGFKNAVKMIDDLQNQNSELKQENEHLKNQLNKSRKKRQEFER